MTNERQINALFERGNNFIRMGNLPAAEKDYTQFIEHKPDFAPAYFNRGFARQHGRQDIPAAIEDYSRAIALKPDFAEAYANRAIAHQQLEQYPQAIADFSSAIEHAQSMQHTIYNNRGEALFITEDYENALNNFLTAQQLRPGYRYALGGAALCHWRLGNQEDALRIWGEFLERDDNFNNADWVAEEFGWGAAQLETLNQLLQASS